MKMRPRPSRLEVLQQVDDLRLHRNVERRHRLVADDEVGLHRERARDADALPLAAGKLVRVAPGDRGEADPVEVSARPYPRLARPRASPGMASGSADDSRTVMRGLSERVRVLEDDLHAAAHGAEPGAARPVRSRPVEADGAGGWLDEARQHGARQRGRFAAAAFADEAQRLSGREG